MYESRPSGSDVGDWQIQSEFRREFISVVDKQAIVFVTSAGKGITEVRAAGVYRAEQPACYRAARRSDAWQTGF